jgi:glucose/arabinose dehydrogenase
MHALSRGSVKVVVLMAAMALVLAACTGAQTRSGNGPSTTAKPPTTSTTTSNSTTTVPAVGATTTVPLIVPAGASASPFSVPRSLTVPAGWTAEVWARVPDARMEAWSPEGDLLVSEPNEGDIIELAPGSSPQALPTERTVLSGLTQPQGLAFAQLDGSWVLYVGESDQIDRYAWTGSTVSGARTVIAGNLPDLDPTGDDVHRQKDVAVAPDGTVYFNVGSSSNANPDDRTMTPPRAVIMAVNSNGSNLHVVETGVRNGEGLAVAPNGVVWTAVNNRDNITYPFSGAYDGVADALGQVIQAYVNNHPRDEVVPLTQGRDLGWPYCNPDPDLNTPAGSEANVPFVADALTNRGGTALDCASLPRVQVGLAAHSAPLGLAFLEGSKLPAPWSGGAVVAVHGSWDRQPPQPPAVLWMAWNAASATLQPAVTVVSGFQDADGSRWGRPVDAVPGPDGSLYVSDDTAGAIYRLSPPTK